VKLSLKSDAAPLGTFEEQVLLAAGTEPHSRRVFTVTRAGALALAETKSMRERLWAGVELRALLRNV
jgi:hypothetical protein